MSEHRDNRGRFKAGNKAAVGHGPRQGPRSYLAILAKTVSQSDWKEICEKAVEQAKGGNRYAREWLADRLLGKAPQHVTVDDGTQPTLEQYIDMAWDRVQEVGGNTDQGDEYDAS